MSLYESLDMLADSFNPASLILVLFSLIHMAQQRNFIALRRYVLFLVVSLICVYGLMILDKKLGIWASLSMDYSTHTALAFASILFLVFYWSKLRLPLFISLGLYLALMLFQAYHSVSDIVSTALILLVLLLPAGKILLHKTLFRH